MFLPVQSREMFGRKKSIFPQKVPHKDILIDFIGTFVWVYDWLFYFGFNPHKMIALPINILHYLQKYKVNDALLFVFLIA